MRYLIDGRYIQDHFPGIGRYVYNLIPGLANRAPNDQFRVLINPHLLNTRLDLAALEQFPNVQLVESRVPTFSPRGQLLSLDKRITADVALWHSAYYIEPYWMPMPNVVTLEDVTPLVIRSEMPSALKRMLYRVLNLLAARQAAHIITLSRAARSDIERALHIPSDEITVVPLAADTRFRPMTAAETAPVRAELGLPEAYVLYVGSNKPHKNLPRLVEAWSRVPTRIPLIIAGHWDARYPEAKRIAAQLRLGERVRYIHNLSSAQLPALVAGAFLFVFPSVHEGFGLPPLEALACGVPVACANASSLPEVVGDAAFLFDPYHVDSIAAVLTMALTDPAARETYAARGLVQAARFTWERTARETMNVYKSAMSKR